MPPSLLPLTPLLLAPGDPSRSSVDGDGGCAAACSAAGAVASGRAGVTSPLVPLVTDVRVLRALGPLRLCAEDKEASAVPLASLFRALSTLVHEFCDCQWPGMYDFPWHDLCGGEVGTLSDRFANAAD